MRKAYILAKTISRNKFCLLYKFLIFAVLGPKNIFLIHWANILKLAFFLNMFYF